MKLSWTEITLYRVQRELERELLAATDEEVMEAARDLGMNPTMRGSVAFAGLKFPFSLRQMQEYFGVTWSGTETAAEKFANLPTPVPARGRQRKDQADK